MSLAADGLPPLREVVAAHGLAAKKSLGQNFLFDLNLTGRIARASGPLEDVAVVEVGPAPGPDTGAARPRRTKGDCDRARRTLPRGAGRHRRTLAGPPADHRGDALTVAPETLVAAAEGAPIRICANLPTTSRPSC